VRRREGEWDKGGGGRGRGGRFGLIIDMNIFDIKDVWQ
jgi:hypothetical protein